MNLEQHFSRFREHIVGIDAVIPGPFGKVPLVYADWIASGRLYGPIEDRLRLEIGPMVANTHSEASSTGKAMTRAYHRAQGIIKAHVNAGPDDIIISAGSGMTGVVNKLQRILGLRRPVKGQDFTDGLPVLRAADRDAPVVFLTHMEHHSNHISWLETIAEVVVLEPGRALEVRPEELEALLEKYADRSVKIGSFSAASNVTGFIPPYRELARIMHRHGGIAFADFAASAPYVDIDMHPPDDPDGYLDGIFFSPHKFLGGPGSAGVMVFNRNLYHNTVPDNPGGGTVNWTNRWGERSYITDIEAREDGGTPPFLQTIRTAQAILLKDAMGTGAIAAREKELLTIALAGLKNIPGLHILGDEEPLPREKQLGVISFYIEGIHHNLIVALLNDHYGIQVRGGCSCAGTYGHWLLHVSREDSVRITREIDSGDLSEKPGWVRLSLHPTMSNDEISLVIYALEQITGNIDQWSGDYRFNNHTGEFDHVAGNSAEGPVEAELEESWFRPYLS
jgi:selenocysteine lyase/cysteine desulfurase